MKISGPLCVLLISGFLAASACSSLPTTYLANGQKAYAIACKGVLNSWESCLVRAGKVCGARGYDTIRSEEYDRELVFACKTP
jgi:hypothetical protein